MIPFIFVFAACGVVGSGYTYSAAFVLIAVGYPVFRRREIPVNFLMSPVFWLLTAFGCSYVIFGGLRFSDIQNYFLLPLMAYAVGWSSAEQGRRQPETVRDSMLGFILGFALHTCLNYLVNVGHNRYQLIDFWSRGLHSASGSGFLNTLIFAIVSYTLFLEKRRWMKCLLAMITAVCVLYSFMLGTRTQLVILAVTFLCTLVLYLLERRDRKQGIRLLIGAACLVLAAFVCYRTDLFGFRTLVDSSNLGVRFAEKTGLATSDAERLRQFTEGLRNLYQYPLGGQKERLYYHNLWLDVSRVAGLVPFVLMICFHIVNTRHMLRLFRDREAEIGLRYLMLGIYLGAMMNFFVEPVLEGMLDFFLAFSAVNGMVDRLYYGRYGCLASISVT